MPLFKNGKDMANGYIGDQELSKILLGDKLGILKHYILVCMIS